MTGRANYQTHGAAIGIGDQLVSHPELANDPAIAARLLASFLKKQKAASGQHCMKAIWHKPGGLVNGGVMAWREFSAAFKIGDALF
ncbi:MAG: hypothetical protein IPK44_18735 [Candidatus Accumulibacter sp.]|uniref:hypothetical protein n=1 Tax=Accumulibacter sp. TaxID=2053492 RepID=UPI00258606A0|nr:hypothetical protein [Accumulibacter sp.]MBK8116381.1 hypothetical protein [Accumulibacter sp.]